MFLCQKIIGSPEDNSLGAAVAASDSENALFSGKPGSRSARELSGTSSDAQDQHTRGLSPSQGMGVPAEGTPVPHERPQLPGPGRTVLASPPRTSRSVPVLWAERC